MENKFNPETRDNPYLGKTLYWLLLLIVVFGSTAAIYLEQRGPVVVRLFVENIEQAINDNQLDRFFDNREIVLPQELRLEIQRNITEGSRIKIELDSTASRNHLGMISIQTNESKWYSSFSQGENLFLALDINHYRLQSFAKTQEAARRTH